MRSPLGILAAAIVPALLSAFVVRAGGLPGVNRPLTDLPVPGTAEKPILLLELGSAPSTPGSARMVVAAGEVGGHEGDSAVKVGADEVTTLRGGGGRWAVAFRFRLPAGHPAGDYTFWARWKQDGDPKVSVQQFEVWAGADAAKLELRGRQQLRPNGWTYTWVDGNTVTIKPGDTVVEVRNSGNGQTAKIFSAFLLGGPKPPSPPVSSTSY